MHRQQALNACFLMVGSSQTTCGGWYSYEEDTVLSTLRLFCSAWLVPSSAPQQLSAFDSDEMPIHSVGHRNRGAPVCSQEDGWRWQRADFRITLLCMFSTLELTERKTCTHCVFLHNHWLADIKLKPQSPSQSAKPLDSCWSDSAQEEVSLFLWRWDIKAEAKYSNRFEYSYKASRTVTSDVTASSCSCSACVHQQMALWRFYIPDVTVLGRPLDG